MLLFSLALLMMTLYNFFNNKGVECHKLFLLYQVLIPTVSITVMYNIAKKHEASVDLHGPIILGSYGLTLYVITSFNLLELNGIARTYEFGLSVFFYLLYIGFLSIDFLPHFIVRSVLYGVVRIHVGIYRVSNDESELLGAILLNFCFWALVETMFYVQ